VVHDTVTEDGEVVEDTFDWYAQDADGNIWYLGDDTAEFEDGKVKSRGGSWEAGVDGALPGIMIPADPAEDNGEVLSVGEQVEVPAGHYTDALLTKDTTALEPKVLEFRLYAPDVGPVLTLGVSGGGGREELVNERVGMQAARAAGEAPLGERYP
jgi:hypothetical protein